jgi:hypothetical protein
MLAKPPFWAITQLAARGQVEQKRLTGDQLPNCPASSLTGRQREQEPR